MDGFIVSLNDFRGHVTITAEQIGDATSIRHKGRGWNPGHPTGEDAAVLLRMAREHALRNAYSPERFGFVVDMVEQALLYHHKTEETVVVC